MKASMISVLAIVATAHAGYVVSPPPVDNYPVESYPVESYHDEPTPTNGGPKPTYSPSNSTHGTPMPTYPASSDYMTSTMYETKVYTVTACPTTVHDCPVGRKTSTIITKTTVCPVKPTATPEPPMPTPSASSSSSSASDYTTSTVYETKVYTVTACPPYVPDCPVGQKTSTIITKTTVCPVKPTYPPDVPVHSSMSNEGPAPTGVPSSTPNAPYPTNPIPSVVSKPYSTGSPTGTYPAKNTTVPFVNSGAASVQAGGLLMAVGLAAALL